MKNKCKKRESKKGREGKRNKVIENEGRNKGKNKGIRGRCNKEGGDHERNE